MPNFSASLRDNTGAVALSVVGSTISISDYSNYIASTETGNLLTDFYLKEIIVQKLGTTTTYTFASYAGFDELIPEPRTFLTTPYPPIINFYTFSSDGVYSVTLRTVPKYNSQTTYALGNCVATSGLIYQSLKNTNTDPLTTITSWEVIPVDQLPPKYNVTEYIAIDCGLLVCLADMIITANCINPCPSPDLCKDEAWVNTALLQMAIDSIQTYMDVGSYNQASEVINFGNTLCSCCK